MRAIVISSANDAAVAVAEHVYGNDKHFIKKMNSRAQELGMNKTLFFSSRAQEESVFAQQGNCSLYERA